MDLINICGTKNKTEVGKRNYFDLVLEEEKKIYSNSSGKNIFFNDLNISSFDVGKDGPFFNENVFRELVCFVCENNFGSFSLVKSFFDYNFKIKKESCLIIFDSSLNLLERQPGKSMENGGWVRSLVMAGFKPQNILIVGGGNYFKEEKDFLNQLGIKLISVEDIFMNLEGRTDYIMEFGYGKNVFVSMNLEIIDSIFFPKKNVGGLGGLNLRELIYITKRLRKMKNLNAFEIVCKNFNKDESGFSEKLCAKIISELV